MKKPILFILTLLLFVPLTQAQHSVARQWNEILLDAIREDFARPTVHARNLFHTSAAMYDCWAAYDSVAAPFFLGNFVSGYYLPFEGVPKPADVKSAREEAICYALSKIIVERFSNSPNRRKTRLRCDSLMTHLGYDPNFSSTDYASGNPAALGNYVGAAILEFGLNDGANEQNLYTNEYYKPANPSLSPRLIGNPDLIDPNRWQPLNFLVFVGQGGVQVGSGDIPFLSPEWGQVAPFALKQSNKTTYIRDGFRYQVYHDPGAPTYLDTLNAGGTTDEYKWGFSLVSKWSAHLDPSDGVMWDISPASIGNIQDYPTTLEGLRNFYNEVDGGDPSPGHAVNPHTGQPYEPNIVPRGDYARVLAEFWADGPDSETPPGHWYTILNYVNDHPLFERKFKGEGPIIDELEWDVKAYFTLGGAMHDAAVTAWGIKGYYDYLRPVSAIRWMADQGQSTEPDFPNYSPLGIPLHNGLIELVRGADPLVGFSQENLGKIKLKAWLGPTQISDPATDVAGVGWVLAERWWPYQRPTFVTPPFAGYISGHSTFSRAAAEVMTRLTGDAFFPGGMGEFVAKRNEFLVFEEGPSVDVTLQWATYRDASDQTSLSRIWGGIHPPVDDIPGRLIGEKIGNDAFDLAEQYFGNKVASDSRIPAFKVYPNPVRSGERLAIVAERTSPTVRVEIFDLTGKKVLDQVREMQQDFIYVQLYPEGLNPGVYAVRLTAGEWMETQKLVVE